MIGACTAGLWDGLVVIRQLCGLDFTALCLSVLRCEMGQSYPQRHLAGAVPSLQGMFTRMEPPGENYIFQAPLQFSGFLWLSCSQRSEWKPGVPCLGPDP